jgi:hypothetical protein
MRPTILIALLATLALFSSIARGGEEKKRAFEARTIPASLPKSQATKTVFATVKVTGEVGEDE